MKEKPNRFYDLKVEFEKEEMKISGAWTAAPVELFEKSLNMTKARIQPVSSRTCKD